MYGDDQTIYDKQWLRQHTPHLWPQFKQALAQVEEAMIKEGWLDKEDLVVELIT